MQNSLDFEIDLSSYYYRISYLKTKHFNNKLSSLIFSYKKNKKVIIFNSNLSFFLLRRASSFLIELTYNKGYTVIFNDSMEKDFEVFLKFFLHINSNSVLNGFITNNRILFNNKEKKRKKSEKISDFITFNDNKIELKKEINHLYLNKIKIKIFKNILKVIKSLQISNRSIGFTLPFRVDYVQKKIKDYNLDYDLNENSKEISSDTKEDKYINKKDETESEEEVKENSKEEEYIEEDESKAKKNKFVNLLELDRIKPKKNFFEKNLENQEKKKKKKK